MDDWTVLLEVSDMKSSYLSCTDLSVSPDSNWLGVIFPINPLKTRQNLAEISKNELCHPLHNQKKKKNTRVFSFVDYNCL